MGLQLTLTYYPCNHITSRSGSVPFNPCLGSCSETHHNILALCFKITSKSQKIYLHVHWKLFFQGRSCYASQHRCPKINTQKMHIQIYIPNYFSGILKTVLRFIKILPSSPPHQRLTQNQKLLTEEWGRAAVPLPNIFSNPLTTHAKDTLHSFSNISYTDTRKTKENGSEQRLVLCCGLPTQGKIPGLEG